MPPSRAHRSMLDFELRVFADHRALEALRHGERFRQGHPGGCERIPSLGQQLLLHLVGVEGVHAEGDIVGYQVLQRLRLGRERGAHLRGHGLEQRLAVLHGRVELDHHPAVRHERQFQNLRENRNRPTSTRTERFDHPVSTLRMESHRASQRSWGALHLQ
eukprot:9500757-Pyramimonas_sp.AAC.2